MKTRATNLVTTPVKSRQPKPTPPTEPPSRGVKAATFKLLLDTAMEIIREAGHIPTVAEVAVVGGYRRASQPVRYPRGQTDRAGRFKSLVPAPMLR